MHEPSLFEHEPANDRGIALPVPDAELTFFEQAFSVSESDEYFGALMSDIEWRHDRISIHGKSILLPRLQAWFCDPGYALHYSGMSVPALPLNDVLRAIRERVTKLTGAGFNGVLVNCYRDGNDSVGWHCDDEPEWGPNPVIASVSFGATRDFVLKHLTNKALKPYTCPLTHGSLLLMGPGVQSAWQHQLPKRKRITEPRINLTFRNLLR